MKLLVADDDMTTRTLLVGALSKWKYEVIAAGDGDTAWGMLSQPKAPKLAILDWLMPGLEGIEICRRLRQADTEEPTYIIMLTIRRRQEDIVAGLDAGANDYITKPFDMSELRARVGVGRRVVELQSTLAARARELQEALDNVRTLRGLLPICSFCNKIRDDEGQWNRVDVYIQRNSEANLSHGVCPDCAAKHYPEYAACEPAC